MLLWLLASSKPFWSKAEKTYRGKEDQTVWCKQRQVDILTKLSLGSPSNCTVVYIGERQRHHEQQWNWMELKRREREQTGARENRKELNGTESEGEWVREKVLRLYTLNLLFSSYSTHFLFPWMLSLFLDTVLSWIIPLTPRLWQDTSRISHGLHPYLWHAFFSPLLYHLCMHQHPLMRTSASP